VYFSQPAYWRADYGFRGDWQAERIMLFMDRARTAGLSVEEAWTRSRIERNLVREMVCELRAVKPAREPRAELQKAPRIEIVPAD
jgi:hypothetical protein